jgi:hypothetical protein
VVSVTSRPRFSPGERNFSTHCTGGWWAPEPVWTQGLQEKLLASAGDRISIAQSPSTPKSASRPGRALVPEKGTPVPIVQEAGWAPEPVWTQGLQEIFLASTGDRISIAQSPSTPKSTKLSFVAVYRIKFIRHSLFIVHTSYFMRSTCLADLIILNFIALVTLMKNFLTNYENPNYVIFFSTHIVHFCLVPDNFLSVLLLNTVGIPIQTRKNIRL